MSVDPKQPADTAAPFDPASAAGWQRHAVDGFLDLVGPIWERPSGDSYRYAFLAEPKHHSRRGHVQGGMLTRFADRAMGRTCWHANERQPQTTVQLDIHFVDGFGSVISSRQGARWCEGRARWCFMSAELVVGERVVATANGIWKTLGKG